MLAVIIEVLEIVGMMRAMLVAIMKVVMMINIKDKDGENKFDCGDDVNGCDNNIDDGVDDGCVNINRDDDAKKDNDSKVDIEFEGNDE